jgi:hypothetical protein
MAHRHAHRALVLSTRSAAGPDHGVDAVRRAEGELRKRQKKAEDQQQRADLPTPSSFVLLFSRSQRVHAFMEAAPFWPASSARPVTRKQTPSQQEAHTCSDMHDLRLKRPSVVWEAKDRVKEEVHAFVWSG